MNVKRINPDLDGES